MKMMLCGKGGCGKSTVTALLAKEYVRQGRRVLVIDCDESNYGLHQQLGMELPKDFMDYFGKKDKVLKQMLAGEIMTSMKLEALAKKFFSKDITTAEIPEEYYTEKDGIRLISSGKIHDANEGCACPMNTVIGQFVSHLKLDDDEVVIMDMEAGLEHFGRGTGNGCDKVLMVVDPSYESLKLSRKIGEICEQVGHPIGYVLNKVTDRNKSTMEANIPHPEKIVGRLPRSEELETAGLEGDPLEESFVEIRELIGKIA